ncbi:MAG TPA: PAS domain-containing protein, partial [Candidatus Goldiibacteriota bacterium]|nr:PAS domain-containing protein [Candidatus Goldiibacteriota bacterium]
NIRTGIIEWDGAITGMTGYAPDWFNSEVSLDVWGEMIHPDDRERAYELLEEAERNVSKYTAEYRFKRRDGRYIDVLDEGVFVPDEAGEPYRMLGAMKDITQIRRGEQVLRESEEKFRTLSEQSLLASLIVQDDVVKYANRGFSEMSGYDVEEVYRWPAGMFIKIVCPEFRDMANEQLRKKQAGETDVRQSYQVRITTKNGGQKWAAIFGKTIMYEGRPADFISAVDITEIKETQERLRDTILELERSNAELERFAYVASHDLQEPLRMVSSYVQLLERRYKDKLGSDANDFINYAVDGAARMQKLIKDLLLYSRTGRKEKQLVNIDINAIIDNVRVNLAKAIAEKNAEISVPELPAVCGDESQVLQLFQNLISNSLKFSKKDKACKVEIFSEEK